MELKETIKLMESADYKERFKAEYYQLFIRYDKLEKMIKACKRGEFKPTCPISVLEMQLDIMGKYLGQLLMRAQYEKINLYVEESVDE